LFDAAWLLEADVGFLHPGYDDFSGANFNGGSVIFIVDNRVPRINSNITSLIFRDERNKGSLCHAPSIIRYELKEIYIATEDVLGITFVSAEA
jgi:hypothetical protein